MAKKQMKSVKIQKSIKNDLLKEQVIFDAYEVNVVD